MIPTTTATPVRAAIFGTGKLAADLARFAPPAGVDVVAAVTTDPAKRGTDLGDLLFGEPSGVVVSDNLADGLAVGVDVLLYGGHAGALIEVLGTCADAGVDVITSVNMFVGTGGAQVSDNLDRRARAAGARILGTGLVPGFRLDYLPAVIATTAPDPVTVHARHVSTISAWTPHVLKTELGIGELREPFGGALMHYLEEAFGSLVAGVGLAVDRVQRSSTPMITDAPAKVGALDVAAGDVVGFLHTIVGEVDGTERVRVEWTSSRELEGDLPEGTEIVVTGADGLVSRATLNLPPDGYPGTAARMVKAVRPLRRLEPGMRRVHELAVR